MAERSRPLSPAPDDTPPAVAPFVRVLGVAKTVELLLELGGAEIYLSPTSNGSSRLSQIIGREGAAALADRLGAAQTWRIPTARRWVALQLADQGLSKAAIARRLHVTDVTVRSWINDAARETTTDPRQPRLL